MIKRSNIIAFVLLLFITACVEEYDPQLTKFENLLVVDGMITNDQGPYTVRLSLSSDVQNPNWSPISGASVTIHEMNGTSEKLTETEAGIYSTQADGIQGIPGKFYRIEIESQGESYQSQFEELKAPVELDTVYTRIETRPPGELHHEITGLQFYVDTKPAISDSNYLLWLLEATYKYTSDLKIRFIFDGTLRPILNPDTLRTCWRTFMVPEIYTSQTATLSQNRIKKFPLQYVSTETRLLFIRYSLLVNQYTLSKDAWEFWDRVREQNEEQGGLYSQQPYQIEGNVANTHNADVVVLGRFTVAGLSKRRIFIDKPFLPFYFVVCEITEGDMEAFSTISLYPPNTWPVFATTSPEGGGALPAQQCLDCRLNGGSTEKPDFWIDKQQ